MINNTQCLPKQYEFQKKNIQLISPFKPAKCFISILYDCCSDRLFELKHESRSDGFYDRRGPSFLSHLCLLQISEKNIITGYVVQNLWSNLILQWGISRYKVQRSPVEDVQIASLSGSIFACFTRDLSIIQTKYLTVFIRYCCTLSSQNIIFLPDTVLTHAK